MTTNWNWEKNNRRLRVMEQVFATVRHLRHGDPKPSCLSIWKPRPPDAQPQKLSVSEKVKVLLSRSKIPTRKRKPSMPRMPWDEPPRSE